MKFSDYMKGDYVGAGVVFVTPDKKILLLQKENKKWTFPGGHRNPGEEPLQTAQRECLEELGLTPEGTIVGRLKITKDEVKLPVYSFFKTVEEEFVPTLSLEHIGHRWIDYKKVKPASLTKVFQPYWGMYDRFLKTL